MNHLFHLLGLNQVGFQLKLIILLKFILNQQQKNGMEEKKCFCNYRGKQILKVENQKMERKNIRLKKSYIPFKKRRKRIIPLRQNLINIIIKFQCLKL